MSTTIRSDNVSINKEDAQLDLSPDTELSVFVIFTSIHSTLKALKKAREIARWVGANVVVVVAQVVPLPLPLDEPPVPMEFVLKRFEQMADASQEKTLVSAWLCRNPMEAFKRILNRDCPVVIGVRKGWMPSRDKRLARKLRRAGYDVVLVKTE
jgi:hypothetical protein